MMRDLLIRQINETHIKLNCITTPRSGWIKTLREAMGMSAHVLAKKLNIKSERTIYAVEKSEVDDSITLGHLRKIANQLNCDLKYALVPREPILDYLSKMAEGVAKKKITKITNSMALEDQKPDQSYFNFLVEKEKNLILNGNKLNQLWQEDND